MTGRIRLMRLGLTLILTIFSTFGGNLRLSSRPSNPSDVGPCCCCSSRSECKCGCQKPKQQGPSSDQKGPGPQACFCEGNTDPLSLPLPRTNVRPDLREVATIPMLRVVFLDPRNVAITFRFHPGCGPPFAECLVETFVLLI